MTRTLTREGFEAAPLKRDAEADREQTGSPGSRWVVCRRPSAVSERKSLIQTPASNNNLAAQIGQGTRFNRVPGVPLFLKYPNCHCINPNQDLVLNPAAWSDAAPGTFGTSSAFYNDFRNARRPNEQLSLGRTFRFGREGMSFAIRAEFLNSFNRTQLGNPTATNPAAATTKDASGNLTGGYGFIDATGIASQPRNGQLVGRFT